MRRLTALKFGMAILGVLVLVGTGCKSTALMSRSDEIKVGQQGSQEVEKQYKLDPNPADQELVRDVGHRIMAANKINDYPFTFKVLDSKDVNAFSLPGGPVYVFKGLVDLTEGDKDELASVVGHEMGHVEARHIAKMYTQGFWVDLVIALGTHGRAQDLARIGEALGELHFSREDEYEADRLGLKFSYTAGYDPHGMTRFFTKLQRLSKEGNSGIDKILRTHPLTADRIKRADGEITKLGQAQRK